MSLRHVHSGKVRDVYEAGEGLLLLVASDRISAFDVVMAEAIPDKGRVLTAMTAFWLDHFAGLAPNHLVSVGPADFPSGASDLPDLAGRAMLVRAADMVKLEFIVRGYLAGSAWREYQATGMTHGMRLPPGMQESEQLPEPLFTPSTKAETGHDENVSFEEACRLVGTEVTEAARDICLSAYTQGAEVAARAGIRIADVKFELGWIDGELALCDEVLTPDSSRFWEDSAWRPGSTPPSLDKEPVRRWLASSGWDQQPPPPPLPPEVVSATRQRYVEAYERITGLCFADWYGVTAPDGAGAPVSARKPGLGPLAGETAL